MHIISVRIRFERVYVSIKLSNVCQKEKKREHVYSKLLSVAGQSRVLLTVSCNVYMYIMGCDVYMIKIIRDVPFKSRWNLRMFSGLYL